MKGENEDSGGAHAQGIDQYKEQTFAAVITFQPDLAVLRRQFSALAAEGVKGVVIDNHSAQRLEINDLSREYGLEFIGLDRNRGIAHAQNVGIEEARRRGRNFLLLLDQDSVPGPEAVAELLRAYTLIEEKDSVGAIGSSYTLQSGQSGSSFVRFRWFGFFKVYCDRAPVRVVEVDFLISSGTLFPMKVLQDVGPMKDELFIDHVDTEWFLRAGSHGYRFYGCCDAEMRHELGERGYRFWFGRWRNIPIHRGFRYFFMFRNSLWLYGQDYAPRKWVSADVLRLFYIFLFAGIFCSSGIENMKWMFRGLMAGIRGAEHPASIQAQKEAESALN